MLLQRSIMAHKLVTQTMAGAFINVFLIFSCNMIYNVLCSFPARDDFHDDEDRRLPRDFLNQGGLKTANFKVRNYIVPFSTKYDDCCLIVLFRRLLAWIVKSLLIIEVLNFY